MPGFDLESQHLWRRQHVAEHCRKDLLAKMVRHELRKLKDELMDGTDEDRAQWLLDRSFSTRDIVDQCGNKLGNDWLESVKALETE